MKRHLVTFLSALTLAGCASAGRSTSLPLGDPSDPAAAPGMGAPPPELTPTPTPVPPAGHHHHEAGGAR